MSDRAKTYLLYFGLLILAGLIALTLLTGVVAIGLAYK